MINDREIHPNDHNLVQLSNIFTILTSEWQNRKWKICC